MKIVVIGAGKVGFNVSKSLSEEQHDVIVIDKNPEVLSSVADRQDVMTVVGNGASAKLLEEIGIRSVDVLIAVTENDELNMIACMIAKHCGVPKTVARVRNADYTSPHPLMLSYGEYGIDMFINPEHLAAQEIFRLIEAPMATDMEYFWDGKLSLIGLKVEERLDIVGKTISELNLNKLTVVALIRNGKAIIPNGNTRLLAKDKIFVLGQTAGFHNLNDLMKKKMPSPRRILIAGSSLITQYLLRLLHDKKNIPDIKVIDTDTKLLRTLAQTYPKCSFINADPTKIEILQEEKVGSGDIFISLLGAENSNLVACLLANKLGAHEIICEIGREDYIPLAETIGITATITPRLLTANTVLKLVRGTNVVSINVLDTGDAEVIELIADKDSPITIAPLKDLAMPREMVIGAVVHNDELIVPRGNTIIYPGDHVIVFALRQAIPAVQRYFAGPEDDDDKAEAKQ